MRGTIAAGQTYLYAHLPLLIGLAALGAGIKLAIKATEESGLTDEVSWIIGAAWPSSWAPSRSSTSSPATPGATSTSGCASGRRRLRSCSAALGPELGIVPFLAILAVALVAQVVLELATHESHRHGEGGIEIG